jgi:hypothetical protein
VDERNTDRRSLEPDLGFIWEGGGHETLWEMMSPSTPVLLCAVHPDSVWEGKESSHPLSMIATYYVLKEVLCSHTYLKSQSSILDLVARMRGVSEKIAQL